jgi:hypothetical protein
MSNKNKPDLTLIPSDFTSIREINSSVSEIIQIDNNESTVFDHNYTESRNIALPLSDLIKFGNVKTKQCSVINLPIDNVAVTIPSNRLDYGAFIIPTPFFDIAMTSQIINKSSN